MALHISPEIEEKLKTLAARTGQAPEQLLAEAIARYESAEVAALDWSACPVVERVPGKMSGAWVLRGTRMPVSTSFENLEAGANVDDIVAWYDRLDREHVKAVIEFAVRSLDPSAH
jgi:uncharacterized protein (DUF433 family)